MKKRAVWMFLALTLSLTLCACAGKDKTLRKEDISMTACETVITADSQVSSLLEAFGENYEMAEAVSCVYTGLERTYSYGDLILYTYPGDDGAEHLMEAYAAADAKTSRGVAIGSSLKDVEAAYGADYTKAGSTVSFALAPSGDQMVPASVYFELSGDTVTAIGIVAEHRAQ